jgi:AcrR family transcriptional regulator
MTRVTWRGGYIDRVTSPSLAPPDGPVRSPGAQRVLDAALDLFIEHGFAGTSLQDIADRLGVSKAAVYYHFHSKDDLLLALVGPAIDELLGMAARMRTDARPRRGQGIPGYVDYLMRHRRVAVYLTRDATAMGHPLLVEKAGQLRGRVESMLLGADVDELGMVWGGAILQALAGALLAAPAEVSDEWLREELTELGAHLLAGYRKAARRRSA